MAAGIFEPFFNRLSEAIKRYHAHLNHEEVISDLWNMTWNEVIDKHGIDEQLFLGSIKVLDELEMDLHISPYPDYHTLQRLPFPKFLVTTSLTSLQEKKIRALGIERDFVKIIINDTFKKKQTKKQIFEDLIKDYALNPSCTYVIGDNAESEIKAGNELGMVTVQMLRQNVLSSPTANFHIHSFVELEQIMTP